MRAIYKRELFSFFSGMMGYVFQAFFLAAIGLYTAIVCLRQGSSNYVNVYFNLSFLFLIIVPILTMRTLSEDRRQKTEQPIRLRKDRVQSPRRREPVVRPEPVRRRMSAARDADDPDAERVQHPPRLAADVAEAEDDRHGPRHASRDGRKGVPRPRRRACRSRRRIMLRLHWMPRILHWICPCPWC